MLFILLPFKLWLPGQDSNLGHGSQSPVCYHYTTGQFTCLITTISKPLMVPENPPQSISKLHCIGFRTRKPKLYETLRNTIFRNPQQRYPLISIVTRDLFQIRTKLPKYSAAGHDSARVSAQNCPTHRPIKRKIIDHFLVDTLYYLRHLINRALTYNFPSNFHRGSIQHLIRHDNHFTFAPAGLQV